MHKTRSTLAFLLCALVCAVPQAARCGKGGHYAPGAGCVRDFTMPQKSGLYLADYTPNYYTDGYYGSNGEKVRTWSGDGVIHINGTPVHITAEANFDVRVDSLGNSPLLFYVFDKDILGAKYGAALGAYYGYVKTKLKADVTVTANPGGIELPGATLQKHVEVDSSNYGFGDLSLMPLWLDWNGEHYETWFSCGLYVPVGSYDSKKFTNLGHGFWSQELAWGAAFYPTKDRATTLVGNLTYEFNFKQRDTDVTPGQNLALEYGISQYLSSRLEIGLSGYSLWQTTQDHGGDAHSDAPKSYVHAAGGECSYWLVKGKLCLAAKYLYEYAARDRTKGQLTTLNLYYVF